jgi:hypothetical protein
VSGETLRTACAASPTPWVGRLPDPLVTAIQASGGSPRQIYATLDDLAGLLRGVPVLAGCQLIGTLGPTGPRMTLEPIGSGVFGTVYRLTVAGQSVALKIYESLTPQETVHGAAAECATGLYLSPVHFRDLARFYGGNPCQGWALYEFIAPDQGRTQRRGPDLETWAGPEVIRVDDQKLENQVAGVRVDYGGIRKRPPAPPASMAPSAGGKRPMIGMLRESERWPAFQAALLGSDSEATRAAVSHLFTLPSAVQLAAFRLSMATSDPVVQAAAALQIQDLPLSHRSEAFASVTASPHPKVLEQAATQIGHLPPEAMAAAYRWALQQPHPRVQAQAALQLAELPDSFQLEAFRLALDTGLPLVQERAIDQYYRLPPADLLPALRLALQTGSLRIQAAIMSQLQVLPDSTARSSWWQAADILEATLRQQLPCYANLAGLSVQWQPPDWVVR